MAQSEITTRYVQPGAPTDATICSLAVVDCPLEGSASWYDFTLSSGWSSLDHRVAAMRDVPRGTMVRVTNMENGKSVEVLIADYGPAYPDRVIDLSSYAFSKLAPTTQGIIQEVKIELL